MEVFITRRGSGGASSLFAAIGAEYPTGSECTCENKATGKKLTAKDSSGKWVFPIPEAGEWTVTSTNAGKTKSVTVPVEKSRAYSVKLLYWDGELYDSGNEFTDNTGGWIAYSGSVENTADALEFDGIFANVAVQTANAIDVTNFTTLTVEVFNSTANLAYFGISQTKQPPYALTNPDIPYRKDFNNHSAKTTYTIDISEATGLWYPTYMCFGGITYLYRATLS